MSADIQRLYKAAAFGGDRGKKRLSRALKSLVMDCVGPRLPPAGADDLHIAMAKMILWPSTEELNELDAAVTDLAFVERRKPADLTGDSYKLADRRFRGLGLIRSVNRLVAGAERLLREERESDCSRLTQLRTEVAKGGAKGASARALLNDMNKIRRKLSAAGDIDWERHEVALFPSGYRRLACGNASVRSQDSCYTRALEIIVEAGNYTAPNGEKARPLLEWIAALGNPDYSKRFSFEYLVQVRTEYTQRLSAEEKTAHKRAKAAERQRRHRKSKNTR